MLFMNLVARLPNRLYWLTADCLSSRERSESCISSCVSAKHLWCWLEGKEERSGLIGCSLVRSHARKKKTKRRWKRSWNSLTNSWNNNQHWWWVLLYSLFPITNLIRLYWSGRSTLRCSTWVGDDAITKKVKSVFHETLFWVWWGVHVQSNWWKKMVFSLCRFGEPCWSLHSVPLRWSYYV